MIGTIIRLDKTKDINFKSNITIWNNIKKELCCKEKKEILGNILGGKTKDDQELKFLTLNMNNLDLNLKKLNYFTDEVINSLPEELFIFSSEISPDLIDQINSLYKTYKNSELNSLQVETSGIELIDALKNNNDYIREMMANFINKKN